MSYTALYRKFRPAQFEDVKGQDHIVTTLKNQLAADRIGHAYLFCGTRGTGKTTVAKIFAKAVNCEHRVDGNPCGECRMCRTIASGASMNVIEIDAASNNGVDNIREIREEVAYTPAEGRYRVYIIDEVHMLSAGAFNALLKTLEEPPSYVIFILATTEVHKLPITILSRCQRYDFRRIGIDTISDRLMELMEKEHVEAEKKAVRYVAKAADGSMRDALSLLDQCISFYLGQKLTYENVLEVLGAVDTDVFSNFFRKILAGDVTGCVRALDDLIIQGRELGQFVTDFTWYLRNLLLIGSSYGPEGTEDAGEPGIAGISGRDADVDGSGSLGDLEDVLDISSENLQLLRKDAALVGQETLMRWIRIFSELAGQLRFASQKRVLTEITIIRLCRPAMERNLDSVLARLSDLERRMDECVVVRPGETVMAAGSEKISGQVSDGHAKTRPKLDRAVPEEIQRVVSGWKEILKELSGMLRTYLRQARLSLGGENRLQIVLEDETAFDFVNRDPQKEELTRTIERQLGKAVELDIQLLQSGQSFDDSFVDLEKIINMEITIED